MWCRNNYRDTKTWFIARAPQRASSKAPASLDTFCCSSIAQVHAQPTRPFADAACAFAGGTLVDYVSGTTKRPLSEIMNYFLQVRTFYARAPCKPMFRVCVLGLHRCASFAFAKTARDTSRHSGTVLYCIGQQSI